MGASVRHPDIEAAKRMRRAQLGFALILIAAFSAIIFVIRERQAAAALLETQMAATVADHWLAKDSITITEYADDHLRQKLPSPLFDYSFAIYSHSFRRAKAPDHFVAPDSLPQAVWNELVERETRWSGSLPGLERHFTAVILPAKDAEQWDVVGAVLVAKRIEMRDFWHTLASASGVSRTHCAD